MSPAPDSPLAHLQQTIGDLQRQLAELTVERDEFKTERDEALAQQAANAEVLGVINSSPGDLAPVFDAILEKARRLCGAEFGTLMVRDGALVRALAAHGVPEAFAEILKRGAEPGPGNPAARLIGGEPLLHISDLAVFAAQIPHDPIARAAVELGGVRTVLFVPLRKDDALLGFIAAYRQQVRPFTDKQIALLQNFAAQAVIAIENARLLTETREALEQQTATSEVLQVINSSPGDLTPVFDAILEKALGLCEAKFGNITTYDGEAFHFAAAAGHPEFAEFLSREVVRPSPVTGWGRIAAGEQFVHIVDLAAEQAYKDREPLRVATVELGGARSCIFIPLVKDNAILGALTAYRQQVRPFTDKQIALLQSFTAQAVIAMENARLITETREALEQQTATAEVLGVINSSPGDLGPVFDAMLEKAMRLCEASLGTLDRFDRDRFVAVAMKNVPAACARFFAETTAIPGPGTAPYRFLLGERLAHEIDLASSEAYKAGDQARRALVDLGGARTALQVPLRKEDHVLASSQ